ncbi:hypothetical protein Y032_0146g2552 [Ancylostoma ceylanicum]|uniref:7TM GPCR serpentine receptor class x (Srx) domain-containing protein n=1 Tax=Ancylostoma ceylanicum TaxID=53326 RepID=A0A016T2R3_9BILA|nr:hypothetical protein Y032_0146g2552 [Ancylostoma ceylanicum]
MERSPSLCAISLGYCIIVIFIVVHDLGFNCLMLKYSEVPVKIVEWFFAGVILAISTLADILIAFALLKQRKTLVLSFTNGISTLYLYTFGADSAQIPWIDHIPKLLDLLLALIYTLAIALINNVVRAELMDFIRCRTSKVNLIQSTAVVTQITTRKATAWTS